MRQIVTSSKGKETSELTDAALDWAVLRAWRPDLEWRVWNHRGRKTLFTRRPEKLLGLLSSTWVRFKPSEAWAQGGPIIERERFCAPIWNRLWQQWECPHPKNAALGIIGPTPLIAAMRCFVASKLGEAVDVPEELLA